ncbi:MAG: DUF2298 domain-containing protein [Microgenomates group bacterium]
MPVSDIFIVFQWWSALFLVGAIAYPITKQLFPNWFDNGYFFAKAVGFALVSYLVYITGSLHFLPFTIMTIYIMMGVCFVGGLGVFFFKKFRTAESGKKRFAERMTTLSSWWSDAFWDKGLLFLVEECVFFALLLFWTWVKAHEPSINGLEKFMDYGFMQSILNTRYFPAPDMWWAGGSINYYYFGHLVTAVITKLSGLSLGYTFNLMLATLFAITATMSFSIGYQLLHLARSRSAKITQRGLWERVGNIAGGVLTGFLVTMAGNMQTLYAFTKGYTGEDVEPFWKLLWPVGDFFNQLSTGMQTYWYANATRFIPFSIHEFPSYSFVVSDVHGHVLSLPFVLLAIALLIALFGGEKRPKEKSSPIVFQWGTLVFYGFLLGILLMTNALDGPIYGGLFACAWFMSVILPARHRWKTDWWDLIYPVCLVAILSFITALPFLFFFSSFANGIGVNCPPAFLANSHIGPFLFESVDKCQHSPLWMMWLLWGFFWFSGAWLFVSKIWKKEEQNAPFIRILKVFFVFAIGLIIFPEFLYVKDIYPAHFRSNTMFKLGYQAFIMWSIISGFVIAHVFISHGRQQKILRALCIVLLVPQIFLVSIYPIFSVRSYFNSLKTYQGIWGMGWMEERYPEYWQAVQWLQNQQLTEQNKEVPVIVEAAGDSYTDFNQVSAFTGYPTITGWAVHEWLWRGSFEIVSPRQEDVQRIYESTDSAEIASLLAFYRVRYIIVGSQEREKYEGIQEDTLDSVGSRVFSSGDVTIWDVMKR